MDERDLRIEHDGQSLYVGWDDDDLFIRCDGLMTYGEYCALPMDKARQLRDWLNANVRD